MEDLRHAPEVKAFVSMFHYGIIGIEKTVADVKQAVDRVLESGYIPTAIDVGMIHAPMVVEMLEGKITTHSPISYPLGNMTLGKKLRDLKRLIDIGVRDTAYCLNYRHILDHRFGKITEEVKAAEETNSGVLEIEYNIQATLLNDDEIINACRAVLDGGGKAVKLNTGYGWGTSPEEVALVRRVFGYQLDIHPSGNIRTLAQVDEFMKYDVKIIHSQAVFEITDELIARIQKTRGL